MAVSVNPYRAWLGVGSDEQPPNHYDLLGLSLFQTEPPLIAEAFERQMRKVTPFLSGEHSNLAKRVAGELASAKVVLLTPTTKRLYDAELSRKVLADQAATPATPPTTPAPSWTEPLLPPTAGPAAAPQYPQATGYDPSQAAYGAAPQYPAYPQYAAAPTAPMAIQPGMPQGMPQAPAMGYAAPAPTLGYGNPAPAPQAMPYGYGQPYATATMAGQVQPQPSYAAAAPAQPLYGAPSAGPQYAPATDPSAVPFGSPNYPSTRRYSGAARRKPSSAPLVLGAAIAVLITAGAVWVLRTGDKKISQKNADDEAASESRVVEVARPRGASEFMRKPDSPRRRNERRTTPSAVATSSENLVDRTKPESTQNPPVAEEPADMPAEGMPTEGMPEESMPEDKPATDADPAKPETPEPAPDPAKPEPDPGEPAEEATPEQIAAVKKALTLAHTALGKRDVTAAQDQIDLATLEAGSPALEADVAQAQLVAEHVQGFWNAVRSSLGKLKGAEELTIGDDVINVVEVKKDAIIVRASGRNREYTIEEMPRKLAYALADSWLDKKDPASLVYLGAFEAVDPKGDRAVARQLLQQAAQQGKDVTALLTYLEAHSK